MKLIVAIILRLVAKPEDKAWHFETGISMCLYVHIYIHTSIAIAFKSQHLATQP